MTIAVVDGDIVAYRCAASAEKDSVEVALMRASRLLQDILFTVDADELKLFLSGSRNFRYDMYSEYKANRRDMKRPVHLEPTREYLVAKWGAEVTDGIEADDAIGIEMSLGGSNVCCSLDKDLLQLPGTHFNFVKQEFIEVSEREGWFNFYSQLVLGDKADNIPGYDGKMRVKWPKFLTEIRTQLGKATSAGEMYHCVQRIYQLTPEELIRNARLLYIWRRSDDQWHPPVDPAEELISLFMENQNAADVETVTNEEVRIVKNIHTPKNRDNTK